MSGDILINRDWVANTADSNQIALSRPSLKHM